MAHNIEFREDLNSYSFVSVKEIPWHGLGKILPNRMTAAEAFEFANLNFTVDTQQVIMTKENGGLIDVPNKNIIFRTDLQIPLGIVGSRYTPIQNHDAFTFFDEFIDRNEAIYETAGCLGQGERVFLTAKLPEFVKLSGEDIINTYLLFTLSHDGSAQVEMMFTPIRVVCNNTLQMALNATGKQSARHLIRHTANSHEKLLDASKVMGIMNTFKTKTFETYLRMADFKMDDANAIKFMSDVFLDEEELKTGKASQRKINTLNEAFAYYKKGFGQDLDTTKDTLWGVYNGITGYFQNSKEYNTGSKSDLSKKFKYIFQANGRANTTMQRAYDMASVLV